MTSLYYYIFVQCIQVIVRWFYENRILANKCWRDKDPGDAYGVSFCNPFLLLWEIARARYSFHELQRRWSRMQACADRLARENDEGKNRCKNDGEDVCRVIAYIRSRTSVYIGWSKICSKTFRHNSKILINDSVINILK